jgi:2-methylcitrate dehydratase PrpD
MTDLARTLARYVCDSRLDDIPSPVRKEAPRTLLNWFGCALGGSTADLLRRALTVADRLSGPREASVIGHGVRLDVANAAFINCLSSSLHAFDDTHLVSITHPTGPVAAALTALSETRLVSGKDFAHALLLGIEIECRMGCVLMEPPGDCSVAFTMTGLVGGIGAAAAMSRLLRLNEDQTTGALGLAAIQAAGFRAGFGTMARDLPMAQAARSGVVGALLAAEGFTTADSSLDGPTGLAHVFAHTPNLAAATRGLGTHFELTNNAYKPYPCGIVIHPALEACLDIARAHRFTPDDIVSINLRVHPDAIRVTGLKEPHDGLSAQVSLYHWAAAALVRRSGGLDEASDAAAREPAIIAVRQRVMAAVDESFGRDGASAEVRLRDGRVLQSRVAHCRGSAARPMADNELEDKLLMQARGVVTDAAARDLIKHCWVLEDLVDVGADTRRLIAT